MLDISFCILGISLQVPTPGKNMQGIGSNLGGSLVATTEGPTRANIAAGGHSQQRRKFVDEGKFRKVLDVHFLVLLDIWSYIFLLPTSVCLFVNRIIDVFLIVSVYSPACCMEGGLSK